MSTPASSPGAPDHHEARERHRPTRAADGRREPRPRFRVARTADGLIHQNTLELLSAFEVSI
jgi:hypothetical protein